MERHSQRDCWVECSRETRPGGCLRDVWKAAVRLGVGRRGQTKSEGWLCDVWKTTVRLEVGRRGQSQRDVCVRTCFEDSSKALGKAPWRDTVRGGWVECSRETRSGGCLCDVLKTAVRLWVKPMDRHSLRGGCVMF